MKSFLKAIFISALLFCLPFNSSAADQDILTRTSTSQIYNNQAFNLRVEFPLSWRISTYAFSKPGNLQFSANSPTSFPFMGFVIGPTKESKPTAPSKPPQNEVKKEGGFEVTTEAEGEVMISGHKAEMVLSRLNDHKSMDIYTLTYAITTDTYYYVIVMQGHYKAYAKDRIVFDQIINTLQISPEHPTLNKEISSTTQQKSFVRLDVHILKDGSVESASILESSGDEAIDAAAIKAAKTWKFTPIKDSNGETIEATRVVKINLKHKE